VRNAVFARSAGRQLRRPALLPLPGIALRLALGGQATLVCDGVHAVPGRLESAGFEFRFPDIDAALVDLTGQ
jgi:NAD dependent epimerase/dehydratase family enzyme